MSRTPVPVDQLPKESIVSGRMNFKENGTFEGKVSMPGAPGTDLSGTYQVEGDVLTINNAANNSKTKSKARLEKDYLVLEPVTREPFSFIFYYKRAG